MKIICDNRCYVEKRDLEVLDNIPYWVQVEIDNLDTEGLFVTFKNEDSIDFFENCDDIIDYFSIKNLSDESIDKKIDSYKRKLARHSNLWLNDYDSREKRNIDEMRKIYMNKIKNLESYKKNRDFYDEFVVKNRKSLRLTHVMKMLEEE